MSNLSKSNAAPSDQNPPKAKRGRKPKALQSVNSQANNETAKSKEVSVVQTAKTAKSAAQTKASVKSAAKTVKATTQAKAEVKPVPNTPAKTPSSGKPSAKAIQAALTA